MNHLLPHHRRSRLRVPLLAGLLSSLLVFSSHLVAQEADPFGGAVAKPAPAKKKEAIDTSNERDPAVNSVLESKPMTPEELMRAVQLLMDLNRMELAAVYLDQLLAAKPDEAALAGLQQKFGSGTFFRLSNSEPLKPQGVQLARAVLAAASKVARDPERLNDRVIKLTAPDADTRLKALDDLLAGGDAAVAPLVRALVDENRADEHLAVKQALFTIGEAAVEPLIGALEAPSNGLRTAVIQVLGKLKTPRVLPYLLRPALDDATDPKLKEAAQWALLQVSTALPSRAFSEQFLARRVRALLEGTPVIRLDLDERGVLWHWDGKLKMVVPRTYLADAVGAVEAARVARELYGLAPGDVDYQRLYVTAQLEAQKLLTGLDRKLPRGKGTAYEIASEFGPEFVEALIPYAQSVNRLPALISALEVIGDIGRPEMLYSTDGSLRPVAKILGHTDRRARFAAMDAILRLNPRQPFPGASLVADSLGYFAGATGMSRILVAYPRMDDGQSYVGMLSELGMQADVAISSREAFLLLIRQPDYEFAIISEFMDKPRTGELIQSLRQETRTSSLPIAVLVRPDQLEQVRGLYETDPLIEAFARPYKTDGLDYIVQRLQERARRRLVGRNERLRQALTSLEWMAKLTETDHLYGFYELRAQEKQVETALTTPELSVPAAKVLGNFGSPRAQQALLDFASQNAKRISDRQAAADAFQVAVSKRGLLVLRTTLALQYDRYNQSAPLDAGTQQLLGGILDTIETKGGRVKPINAEKPGKGSKQNKVEEPGPPVKPDPEPKPNPEPKPDPAEPKPETEEKQDKEKPEA